MVEAVRLNIVATYDHAVEFQALHTLSVLPVESVADEDSFLEELYGPVDDICRCGRGLGIVALPACVFMLSASYFRPFRRWRRRRKNQCVHCGYDLNGNVSGVCPECGTKVED
jgi:hypothetical protein